MLRNALAAVIGINMVVCAGAAETAPTSRPVDFQIGADVSSLPQVEAAGGVFKDRGKTEDLLSILNAHGVNRARLRIWNHPKDGHCDLQETLAMAKRLKQVGMPWLLDFHYSDVWADPGNQFKPAEWANLSGRELEEAVTTYTRNVIDALERQGTPPEMVQIGNEISPGMLWPDGRVGGKGEAGREQWKRLAGLLKAGIRGVREGRGDHPPISIMIHLDRGGDNKTCHWYFDHLLEEGVEFDVIGLSYYPWWHGHWAKLRDNLNDLSRRYGKDLIVVETAWPWSPKGLEWGRPMGEALPPPSVEGQKQFLSELVKVVKEVDGGRGRGVYYWEPGWLATPKAGSFWIYRTLFDRDGELLDSINGLTGAESRQ